MMDTGFDGDGSRELAAAGYAWEIADAEILHRWLTLADLAHVLELDRLGALPAECRLIPALLQLWEVDAQDMGYDASFGEVYTSREHWLRERIGDDAGFLHQGRTRREAVRTAFRMACRVAIADLLQGLVDAVGVIDSRSLDFQETVLPDYTYLQPAQPTTFGHYLLGFADPLLRDARRLLLELGEVDASPAGSGAANGSALALDRDRVSEQLGFTGPIRHLRDAMWQTDPFLHATIDATSAVLTLDRLAEDLEIYSSREFGFVSLGDGLVRPSVLMPQKRNPYALSVVRGTAAILIGRSGGQLALAKSPSARSDSLIYAYGEVPRALDLATRATALMTAVVATLTLDPARMRDALTGSHVEAADVAAWLCTTTGMDYASAHAVVARALGDGGLSASSIEATAASILGRTIDLDERALDAILDPAALVRRREAAGSPADVEAMVAEHEMQRSEILRLLETSRDRWQQAETRTIKAARDIAVARGGQT